MCMPSPNILALIVAEILAFIRIDGHGYIDRLVMLIKNIYIIWAAKRFILPVTYFPSNLVYRFTLRVRGINIM